MIWRTHMHLSPFAAGGRVHPPCTRLAASVPFHEPHRVGGGGGRGVSETCVSPVGTHCGRRTPCRSLCKACALFMRTRL